MPAAATEGWTKWLNTHSANKVYDQNPDKVTKLCTGSTDIDKFEKLARNKNLVLLTRAQIGEKLKATFFHSVVGVPIIKDDLHYVARTDMKYGIGVELDPKSMFTQTAAKPTPDVLSMMQVKSIAEFEALTQVHGRGKKIDCFAVLTPSLAEVIQSCDMTLASIFVKVIEQIKVNVPATTQGSSASSATATGTASSTTATSHTGVATGPGAATTADDILTAAGKDYEGTLRFLWAVHHLKNDIKTPTMSNLQDEVTLKWEKVTTEEIEPKTSIVAQQTTTQQSNVSHSGAMTAMTKLSDTMIA